MWQADILFLLQDLSRVNCNKPVSYNKIKLFPFSYDKINAAIFNTVWQYLWQKLFLKHYENKMVFHLVYLITLKILFVLFCKNIF